eukprot:TRINITY_DN1105_c0_g1_i1.p1 TRINITY_DN1105_c0_g1~~TRINITY_DN1105_c0_g1_i1.p1  ORF type:complete len:352 (+),score=94.31 TRINITY_DN1105_c0_g1_i1:52-1107(+)
MGCGTSVQVDKEEKQKAKAIEARIKKDKKDFEREVKLLLLGAGDSGKSTIAKQMKIIHLQGFTEEERLNFKDIIHSNIVNSMQTLIQAANRFEMEISKKLESKVEAILNLNIYPLDVNPEIGADIAALWKDKTIQKAFERSSEYQFFDSAAYYFENIERICLKDYIPLDQDILRARAKTAGITETEFEVENTKFRMVDVGGQRSERKKWIHCFQDVTAVIFCVALSEYDLKLYEDESVNRMHESLKLFEEICNSKWFHSVSVILFLNKSDLFKEKIKHVDLKVAFPEYEGGLDFDSGVNFVQEKFVVLNKNPTQKQIYPHITCATDTQNIKFVFNAVKNIILHKALDASGF